MKFLLSSFSALSLVGCASAQLNFNTVDLGSTYQGLILSQVITNLARSQENPSAIPSQVKVSVGSASTTNSITPTFSVPLSPQVALTSATSGLTRALTTSGRGLSLAANDQWQQSWSLDPVSDPDQLRRLRTLYKYAVRSMTDDDFECTYPLIETGASGSATASTTKTEVSIDGKVVNISTGPANKAQEAKTFVRKAYLINNAGRFIGYTYTSANPDRTFTRPPGCILCDYGHTRGKDTILEKNIELTQDWLANPESDPAIPLTGGLKTIYIKSSQNANGTMPIDSFYEFVLFTQEAAVQGTGSPASGGQSNGRKTEPTQKVLTNVLGSSATP